VATPGLFLFNFYFSLGDDFMVKKSIEIECNMVYSLLETATYYNKCTETIRNWICKGKVCWDKEKGRVRVLLPAHYDGIFVMLRGKDILDFEEATSKKLDAKANKGTKVLTSAQKSKQFSKSMEFIDSI
jgi:hypothetical protein